MVGIFSSLSGGRERHRRTRSSSETVLPNSEVNSGLPVIVPHGLETAADFKPIGHLVEPPDDDRPVKCPEPEPSMLNERRIWKERLIGNIRWLSDLSTAKGDHAQARPESEGTKCASPSSSSPFVNSLSGPEHNTPKLVEKCDLPED